MADDLPNTVTNFIKRLEDKHNAIKWINSLPDDAQVVMISDYEDATVGPVQSFTTLGEIETRDLFWLLHQYADMVKFGEVSFEEFDVDDSDG